MTRVYFILVAFVLGFVVGGLVGEQHATAQAVEQPTLKFWGIREGRMVDVIETAGACLYFHNGNLAALPKGQLPPGKGC